MMGDRLESIPSSIPARKGSARRPRKMPFNCMARARIVPPHKLKMTPFWANKRCPTRHVPNSKAMRHKGFVAATPLIVRGISGNLMVAAALAIVSGSAGVLRGLLDTSGVQGHARIGAPTTGEAIARGAVQAPVVVRSAAATASAQLVSMADRAKRLGGEFGSDCSSRDGW